MTQKQPTGYVYPTTRGQRIDYEMSFISPRLYNKAHVLIFLMPVLMSQAVALVLLHVYIHIHRDKCSVPGVVWLDRRSVC